MALPLSGFERNCVLLTVSAPSFNLTIKGPPSHKIVEDFKLHRDDFGEFVRAKLLISGEFDAALVFDPLAEKELSLKEEDYVYPCFFERTNYELVVEKTSEVYEKLTIAHQSKKIRAAIGPVGRNSNILSGILNFEDEVGFSHFTVLGDGKELLSFEIEVFPAKLDYRSDFEQLLREVNEEVYNLAFSFLMKTRLPATLYRDDMSKPTAAEFYYILSSIFIKLKKALELIERNPHRKIVTENRVILPEKVKKTDAKTVRWLASKCSLLQETQARNSLKQAGSIGYLPRRLIENNKIVTYDTFENRFTKWILKKIKQLLDGFVQRYTEGKGAHFDEQVLNKAIQIGNYLENYSSNSFLKGVGCLSRVDNYSLVMQLAPGYRDVHKYYLMLQKGLQINSNLFNLSIKDLSILYEYWCFLKIMRLLSGKYELVQNSFVKTDRRGITIDLIKGKESTLTFYDQRNKEQFSLIYNRFYVNLPTLAQKPDNVLQLEKKDANSYSQYVLDAKYRVTSDVDYLRSYNQAGPPEDTINAMHRYRDAIVAKNCTENNVPGIYRRDIFGAFILFPHNDELKYAGQKGTPASKFYDSIEEIGIGALPFLPGQTKLVERLLDGLIIESAKSTFERTTIPTESHNYMKASGNISNVLVGPLRRKAQLQACLDHQMYYTYLDVVKNYLGRLEYVALYQSKRLFNEESKQGIFYYGRVKDFFILKRSQIIEMPSDPNNRDRLAVKFLIEEWVEKSPKILAMGYGPARPVTTSFDLLMEARYYPELHLKASERRLWQELKRFKEDCTVKYANAYISEEEIYKSMAFPGLVIHRGSRDLLSSELMVPIPSGAADVVSSLDGFLVQTEIQKQYYTDQELNSNPGKTIRSIIDLWKDSLERINE